MLIDTSILLVSSRLSSISPQDPALSSSSSSASTFALGSEDFSRSSELLSSLSGGSGFSDTFVTSFILSSGVSISI